MCLFLIEGLDFNAATNVLVLHAGYDDRPMT